jgi:hypothetical protein
MDKRGLLGELAGLIIFALIVILIAGSFTNLYGKITTTNEENQARATLDRFANFLLDLEIGKSDSFIIYNPKGFYFVPQRSEICICDNAYCDSEKAWCKDITKPIKYSGSPIRIELGTLGVTASTEGYTLSFNAFQGEQANTYSTAGAGCSGPLVYEQGKQMTESIKPLFEKAAELAKADGYTLEITSAYRTEAYQQDLWEIYQQNLMDNKNADPACQPLQGKICPHQTGCALDVCIGTLCEPGGKHPGLFVSPETTALETIMGQAGFVRFDQEYWHFEYGTIRWQTCKAINQKNVVCA